MTKNDTHDEFENMSFEKAMAELETLVSQLEGAHVPLDDAISLYERGAKLKLYCEKRLKAAEERIAEITVSSEGAVSASLKSYE